MISVIVPVYRVEPYLRKCIESILNQSYRDLEIILIDDGSPDECGTICEEYKKKDNRIRVIHTDNGGLSAARNTGLNEAAGEYLGFVDSDDWIEHDMFELLVRRLEETGADIGVCGIRIEPSSHHHEWRLDEAVYSSIDAMEALIDGKINNNVWNKLYRRDLFQGIRFPEGKNYEDTATMHKIIDRAEKIATIGKIAYHYRIRHGSITRHWCLTPLNIYKRRNMYWRIMKLC